MLLVSKCCKIFANDTSLSIDILINFNIDLFLKGLIIGTTKRRKKNWYRLLIIDNNDDDDGEHEGLV